MQLFSGDRGGGQGPRSEKQGWPVRLGPSVPGGLSPPPTPVHLARAKVHRGFRHQEASQAHGQEEAPQAAQEDAHPASPSGQVVPAAEVDDGARRTRHRGLCRPRRSRCAPPGRRPAVDRVIGVDVVPPGGDLGPVSFVRADIRNPVIAKVIAGQEVDTVVHLSVRPSGSWRAHGGQGAQRHRHDAAARGLPEGPGVERLVVRRPLRSTARRAATRRCSPRTWAPSGCRARASPRTSWRSRATSAASPGGVPTSRSPCSAQPTSWARRRDRPSCSTCCSRSCRHRSASTPGSRSFTRTTWSAWCEHATLDGPHGTFNVAGAGVLMLSQALRRLGRPRVPVPPFALNTLGGSLRQAGIPAPMRELVGF